MARCDGWIGLGFVRKNESRDVFVVAVLDSFCEVTMDSLCGDPSGGKNVQSSDGCLNSVSPRVVNGFDMAPLAVSRIAASSAVKMAETWAVGGWATRLGDGSTGSGPLGATVG